MTNPDDKITREERLAAKLRENLRRRKAQSRAMTPTDKGDEGESDTALPKSGDGG